MRLPGVAMAVGLLSAVVACAWAGGCSDLSSDCDLNLNCPAVIPVEPVTCSGIYAPGACNLCLQESCCDELAECADDNACISYCLFGVLPSPPECKAPPTVGRLTAFVDCMNAECPSDCAPMDQCNPVTNNGCAPDGSGCELVYPGIFVCIPPFGTPAGLCAPCNNLNGPYCAPGLHCLPESNTCARYCCNDMDCGTGRCELSQNTAFGANFALESDMAGLCVTMTPGMGPTCDAPVTSVSLGSCFGGFPGM